MAQGEFFSSSLILKHYLFKDLSKEFSFAVNMVLGVKHAATFYLYFPKDLSYILFSSLA